MRHSLALELLFSRIHTLEKPSKLIECLKIAKYVLNFILQRFQEHRCIQTPTHHYPSGVSGQLYFEDVLWCFPVRN